MNVYGMILMSGILPFHFFGGRTMSDGSFEILEALPFLGVLVAEDRKIVYANKAVEMILGWGATEVVGSHLSVIFSESAFESFIEPLAQIEAKEFPALKIALPCRRKDGKDIYCALSLAPGNSGLAIVISLQDAENGSGKDTLTGLHTRKEFFVLAEHEIAMAERFHRNLCLVFIDVDDLKIVNDTLGHSAGDELILTAANILRKAFRASDVLCRFGGDEFVALGLSGTGGEEEMAYRVREMVELEGRDFAIKYGRPVSLSIGAVRCDMNYSLQTYLDRADALMYEEKRQKKEEGAQL